MNRKKIGLRIKSLRVERGFKQDDLAAKLAIGRSTLSKMESGEITPTARTLIELKKIFAVSIDWILTGEGPRENVEQEQSSEDIRELLHAMRNKIIKHAVLSYYYSYKADNREIFEQLPQREVRGKHEKPGS